MFAQIKTRGFEEVGKIQTTGYGFQCRGELLQSVLAGKEVALRWYSIQVELVPMVGHSKNSAGLTGYGQALS